MDTLEHDGHHWPRYPQYSTQHMEVEAHRRFGHMPGYVRFPWTPAINGGHPAIVIFRGRGGWTVSSHDDAIAPNVTHYCAGGRDQQAIPIPLVAGPLPVEPLPFAQRDISASFVGSATHPLRTQLPRMGGDLIEVRPWRERPGDDAIALCLGALARSVFAWCPRGYGVTSYRLYEAMRLGAIPVVLSDRHWLPPMLPWDDIAVVASCPQEAGERMQAVRDVEAMHHRVLAVGRQLSIESVLDWVAADAARRGLGAAPAPGQ